MEGLQLRTVKLWSKGEPVEEIYRIIENNTRFPLELMGDIEAQLAGCFLGRDLTARSPTNTASRPSSRAVATILDQSEAAARAKIRAIPDGIYEAEIVPRRRRHRHRRSDPDQGARHRSPATR